jgi:hypothetical protein
MEKEGRFFLERFDASLQINRHNHFIFKPDIAKKSGGLSVCRQGSGAHFQHHGEETADKEYAERNVIFAL